MAQKYALYLFYKNDSLDINIDNIDEYTTVRIRTCPCRVKAF
jgi:hypothetical protein